MLNPSKGYLLFQVDYYKGIIERLEKENECLKDRERLYKISCEGHRKEFLNEKDTSLCLGEENVALKKQIRELQEKLKPEEKPLPCPFCGSDPYFFINDFERNFVSCQNTECKVRPSTFSGNKAEVISNWNMRTKK